MVRGLSGDCSGSWEGTMRKWAMRAAVVFAYVVWFFLVLWLFFVLVIRPNCSVRFVELGDDSMVSEICCRFNHD